MFRKLDEEIREKEFSPKRWTPLHKWETKSKIIVDGLELDLDIKVKDYYNFIYYRDIKSEHGIFETMYEWGIPIYDLDEEQFNALLSTLFSEGRFIPISDSSEKSLCIFQDFDLIYSEFVKNYPTRVTCPEDLENMDYYEFDMLLTGCLSSLSNRIQTRTQKEPKAPKGAKGEALSEHMKLVADIKKNKRAIKLSNSRTLKFH